MDITVHPSTVGGTVQAPPSKSYTHRAIVAAGFAKDGHVKDPLDSADTQATASAVEAYGGTVTWGDGTVEIDGFDGDPEVPNDVINCANSGTTIRLAAATAALVDGTTVLTGDASLRTRPHGPLLDAINQLDGDAYSTRGNGQAPLVISGPVRGGTARISGDVSSQFITALLFAGAVTPEGISISLTTPLRSAPYVDITQDLLDDFSITTETTDSGYHVPGNQAFDAPDEGYAVPGDFSSMSYLAAAAALVGEEGVTIRGAHPSAQGDAAIIDILAEMGASVEWDQTAGDLSISAAQLTGITVSVADTPDLLPTLAVLGACADGTTRITDCEHVRYKETDRVAVMADRLTRLGATVEERESTLIIAGADSTLSGGTVAGAGDHRIIMALTVAGLTATGATTITGADDVGVSYPGFFTDLEALGVRLNRT